MPLIIWLFNIIFTVWKCISWLMIVYYLTIIRHMFKFQLFENTLFDSILLEKYLKFISIIGKAIIWFQCHHSSVAKCIEELPNHLVVSTFGQFVTLKRSSHRVPPKSVCQQHVDDCGSRDSAWRFLQELVVGWYKKSQWQVNWKIQICFH